MFKRTIQNNLNEWARQSDRKPLILRGARQVGKTTAVDIFAKSGYNYAYVNLEKSDAAAIFQRKLSPEETLHAIFLHTNISTAKGETLLFLDEIQNSSEAVSMLRYFYEEFPGLYIVAAGSLLEIMIENNRISFPVGRVDFRYLYPMTFDEYLQAQSADQALKHYHTIPFPKLAHPKLLKIFHDYTLVGGLPEVLNHHIRTGDIVEMGRVMDRLLTAYSDDFPKYAKSTRSITRLRHVISAAPFIAGRRIKFEGFGNSTYGSREMGEALRSLEQAMLINLIYPTTSVELPRLIDLKKSPKLQFFDTGLLNYRVGLQQQFFQYSDLHSFYRGLIAEHIVYQEIIASDLNTNNKPKFWVRQQRQSWAEIDYLLPIENLLIPVEVKAGPTGTLRSLHQFMDRTNHHYAMRLYSGDLQVDFIKTGGGKNFKLLNLPYFLSGKLKEYGRWFVDEY